MCDTTKEEAQHEAEGKREGERRNGVKDEEGVDVGDGNTFTLIQDNYGIFLKDMEG